jgi:hypothetical protein
LITEAVLDKYGIEHWRIGSQKEIKEILRTYDYVPPDITAVIEKIKLVRGVIVVEPTLDEFDRDFEKWLENN